MGWADALQGAGAWLAGNGPQYMNAQTMAEEGRSRQEEARLKAFITEGLMAESMIRNGRPDQALQLFESRVESGRKLPPIKGLGGNFDASTSIRDMLRAGDYQGALAQLSTGNQILRDAGIIPRQEVAGMASAKTRQFVDGTVQMVLPDGSVAVVLPNGQRVAGEQAQAALQNAMANEVAYAGQKSGAMAGAQQGARYQYAAPIASAEAQARADVEAATAPQIAADTTAAQEEAKANVERKIAQRGNATAFDAYQQAMNGIRTSFGKTDTGPIAGRMPAVTAGQQTAEGAIAAAAPVLKQLFRSAGEGVFTDRDQQLLIDMLPKRTDHPEVVESKLGMIDSVVAAKLNMSGAPAAQPVPRETPKRRATDQQAPIKFMGFE